MEPTKIVRISNFLSASLFFVLCILLPMVGPAAVLTPQYGLNRLVFGSILLVSLALAGNSVRLARRNATIPHAHRRLSMVWTGIFTVIFVSLVLGFFET